MDWLKTLGGLAPVLGTALGGPLGGMAGAFLADQLGIPQGSGRGDALAAAVKSGDPEIQLKIQQADQAFKLRLQELGIQEAAIYAQDRANARDRERAVGGYAVPILGGVTIAGFFACAAWVLTGNVTIGADAGLVGTVVGYTSAKAEQVISYYFGSSAGQDHRRKDGGL